MCNNKTFTNNIIHLLLSFIAMSICNVKPNIQWKIDGFFPKCKKHMASYCWYPAFIITK